MRFNKVPLPLGLLSAPYESCTSYSPNAFSPKALASFLGVQVKLPLLAPGAMVLDLRRLFTEVKWGRRTIGGGKVSNLGLRS